MGDISIDTIKFCIVFTENIEDLFFSIFPKDYSGVKWDRNTQKDISSRFRFFLTDNFNQSSYSSDISFSCIRNRLTFEFSLPKFLWGHNLNLCWNFDYVLNEFRFYLESKLNISVPLIIHWRLYRVDVCFNFLFPSLDSVSKTIDYLSKMRVGNKFSERRRGKNLCYWVQDRKTVKFYGKYDEMKKHRDNYYLLDSDYFYYLETSKFILRYEEEWRSRILKSFLKVDAPDKLTIGAFLYFLKFYDFNKHISNIIPEFDYSVTKIYELYDLCQKMFGRKYARYTRFLNLHMHCSKEKMMELYYKKSQYYRYRRVFKERVGIDMDLFFSFFEDQKDPDYVNLNFSDLQYISSNYLFKGVE